MRNNKVFQFVYLSTTAWTLPLLFAGTAWRFFDIGTKPLWLYLTVASAAITVILVLLFGLRGYMKNAILNDSFFFCDSRIKVVALGLLALFGMFSAGNMFLLAACGVMIAQIIMIWLVESELVEFAEEINRMLEAGISARRIYDYAVHEDSLEFIPVQIQFDRVLEAITAAKAHLEQETTALSDMDAVKLGLVVRTLLEELRKIQ